MSKLGKLGRFLQRLGKVAAPILSITPLAPIAGIVQAAIGEAEAIHGAGTGAEKLAHVVAIAVDAAEAANTQAGKQVVDVAVVKTEAETVISAVVGAANLAPHPTPTP